MGAFLLLAMHAVLEKQLCIDDGVVDTVFSVFMHS